MVEEQNQALGQRVEADSKATAVSSSSSSAWVDNVAALAEKMEAGGRSRLGRMLVGFYRFRRFRKLCLRLILRLEGHAFFSRSLRDILSIYHKVEVGRYSYGSITRPGVLPRGTEVGNYCSVGVDLIIQRRNHPLDRLSQHPFFFNSRLGLLAHDTVEGVEDNPLTIGHDVWIGDRVIILSGCRNIGNGAVIAGGAVVTRDVPAYAIVAGVPARKLRSRLSEEVAAKLEHSRWWELSLTELLADPDLLLTPVSAEIGRRFGDQGRDAKGRSQR